MMKDNAEKCSFVCRPAVKMEQHSRDEISCIKRLRRCTTGSKRLVTTSTAVLLSGRAASKLEYSVEEKTGAEKFHLLPPVLKFDPTETSGPRFGTFGIG